MLRRDEGVDFRPCRGIWSVVSVVPYLVCPCGYIGAAVYEFKLDIINKERGVSPANLNCYLFCIRLDTAIKDLLRPLAAQVDQRGVVARDQISAGWTRV